MATKIDYQIIVDDILKSKSKTYILTQDKVKRLCNAELPKSMFTKRYFKTGSNILIRFLRESGYEVIITEPKITIKKEGVKP